MVEAQKHHPFQSLIKECQSEHNLSYEAIAAALASLLHVERPIFLEEKPTQNVKQLSKHKKSRRERGGDRFDKKEPRNSKRKGPKVNFANYRMELGKSKGMRPGHIVGAIANELGLDSEFIGDIKVHESHSIVALPNNMPDKMTRYLKKLRILGHETHIRALKK